MRGCLRACVYVCVINGVYKKATDAIIYIYIYIYIYIILTCHQHGYP